MNDQKGFANIILIIVVLALVGAGAYFVSTSYIASPSGQVCPQDAMQCLDGSYVSRTGPNCSFAACPTPSPTPTPIPTPAPNGEKIIRKVGEIENSFLIQKINFNSVDGIINYSADGTVSVPNFPSPKTLHIGDDIGATCAGRSQKLISIDFRGQTVTFGPLVIGEEAPGGCPICLAGKTLIETPSGSVQVKEIQIGMPIWTTDKAGQRVSGVVIKISKVPVSPTHRMVHLVLSDGREVLVSPGHPTIDGRSVGDLKQGDRYDHTLIVSTQRVPYDEGATYDILPSGDTGFYWANGVLLGSTLK